jgi:membrane associated rhomboid family serine protease
MFHGPSVVSIGASGGITGLFAAGLLLTLPFPAMARVAATGALASMRGGLVRALLFAFLPLMMKNSGIDGFAHLGGALGGACVALPLLLRREPPKQAGNAVAALCAIAFVAALAKVALYTDFAAP